MAIPTLTPLERASTLVQLYSQSHFVNGRGRIERPQGNLSVHDAQQVLGFITLGMGYLNDPAARQICYMREDGFRINSKGGVRKINDPTDRLKTPFFMASAINYAECSFETKYTIKENQILRSEFLRRLEERFMPDPNKYYAVRVEAETENIELKTIGDLHSNDAFADRLNINHVSHGVWQIMGFRVPYNERPSLNIPGFHLAAIAANMITGDQCEGGEVGDFILTGVRSLYVKEIQHLLVIDDRGSYIRHYN